jgi:hypothetical protein
MANSLQPRRRVQISAGGLAVGVILGAIYIAVALGVRYAVGMFQNFTQGFGSGVAVTFNVFSFVSGPFFLPMVVAIVVAKAAHRAVKEPHTVKGPLKVILGALSGVFYYLILGGGALLLTIVLTGSTSGNAAATVSLLITLALLELSAGTKIVQGLLEYREAKMEQGAPIGPTFATPPAAPSAPEGRTCANCGAPLGPNDGFCTRCGSQQPQTP